MNKELEALKLVKWKLEDEGILGKEYELCDIIEQELKRLEELEKAFAALSKEDEKTKKLLSLEIEKNRALEIIKNKRVDMLCFIYSKSREQYNEESCSDMYLTVEEYNFLKEILL